jgi:hypothetical protein
MESTGIRNKLQISQETVDLLIIAGKVKWISRREDGEYLDEPTDATAYWR